MSWHLFMDESGSDRKVLPYEVRGGVALCVSNMWPFEQAWKNLELHAFGINPAEFGKELKGSHLLDKDRWKWAKQAPNIPDDHRRSLSRKFLTKGLEHKSPTRDEFTAYGQACLEMVRGVFELIQSYGGQIFAAAIPRDAWPDYPEAVKDMFRKDHVFLFERFFYFLEEKNAYGVVIMDESEKLEQRTFVRQMQTYFAKSENGRLRASRIVPSPMFVSSDMSTGVQAADIVLYAINTGYRLPNVGMNGGVRTEIAEEFGPWLKRLQWQGEGNRDGMTYKSYGITYVRDPYTNR